ncbi:unnamed protein product [Mytilus edulis]|uniref:Uncharacterized protein n=1 Tax=Mytilus edulis TaxID=6550 RepID=A0A8S3TH77_MYTED|nr:unnamed protein product [Mytilus edulis]
MRDPERMDQFSLYLVNGSADGSSDAGLCYTDLGVAGFPKVTQNITSYNGKATQNPPNPSFPASLSIDGKRKDGMCSRTTGRSSYIQVDTGSMSVVTTVYLTLLVLVCITLESRLIEGGTADLFVTDMHKMTCTTKYSEYITFVPPKINGVSTVDVCEIEIGVCAGGYFGRACSRVGSPNCLNQLCNHVTGECYGGCNIGWESYNCTKVFADSSSNDALSTQVGIFIGAFLLGAILCVGIMSIIIRRRLCMAQVAGGSSIKIGRSFPREIY